MIKLKNLESLSEEARDIVTRHINSSILNVVDYTICSSFIGDFEYDDYDDLFPEDFKGNQYDTLKSIKSILTSDSFVDLSDSYKYIINRCLDDYFTLNTQGYSFNAVHDYFRGKHLGLNIVPIEDSLDRHKVLIELAGNNSSLSDIELKMSCFEDLSKYNELYLK